MISCPEGFFQELLAPDNWLVPRQQCSARDVLGVAEQRGCGGVPEGRGPGARP